MLPWAFFCALLLADPVKTLAWKGDYGAALQVSRQSGRPLIVVVEDSRDASGLLAQLRTATPEQGELLARYELCRVDRATSYGESVARGFRADQTPLVAIIRQPNNRIAERRQGQITSEDWTALLQAQLAAPVAAQSSPQGATKPQAAAAAPAKPPTPLHEHPTIVAMLKKCNELRAANKLPPYVMNAELCKAAQDHATYMARTGEFSHQVNGGLMGRAQRYGYQGPVSENIAWGQPTINEVFRSWQGSPPHWQAIIGDSAEAGFGYALSKDGKPYWVAVFGKRFL